MHSSVQFCVNYLGLYCCRPIAVDDRPN